MHPPVYIGALRQPNLARTMSAIQPIVDAAGLTLVGVERAQEGRRTVLWVYLDHAEGITLDQCAEVSPEISATLDVEDPIPEAYDLRVSSPGVERPLMSDLDFEAQLDQPVQIRLLSPLRGRRKFQGRVVKVVRAEERSTQSSESQDHASQDLSQGLSRGREADVVIRCDDGEHQVPLALILRARLHYSNDEIQEIFRARRARERAKAREESGASE